MKCPKCGAELRISKKDPNYGLCDNCRKKYRLQEQTASDSTPADNISTKKPIAKKPAEKAITDETKIMQVIQEIDNVPLGSEVNDSPALPKKRPAESSRPVKSERPAKAKPAVEPGQPAARKRSAESGQPSPGKRRPAAGRPADHQKQTSEKTASKKKSTQSGYYSEDMYEDEPHHKKKKYANIPPSKVRSTREDEMRSGYDELLSIENDKQGIGSTIITAIIIILILAIIGGGGFYLFQRMSKAKSSSKIDAASAELAYEKTKQLEASSTEDIMNENVVYEDDAVVVTV